MQVTRRDAWILTVFTVALVAGLTLYVRSVTRPPGAPDRTAEKSPSEPPPAEAPRALADQPPQPPGEFMTAAVATGEIPGEYRVITDRQLFKPLVKPPVKQKAPSPSLPTVPRVDVPRPAPVKAPAPPAGPPAGASPAQQTPAPAAPPKPPLAVTGLLRAGDGYRVLVENTELKQSRMVRVGEEAFGFRVAAVTDDGGSVTLASVAAQGGSEVTLKLGENKKETAPAKDEKATAGSGANQTGESGARTSSSSPTMTTSFRGGFDPSQLTPEQRQRYEEFRSRRRDRRSEG